MTIMQSQPDARSRVRTRRRQIAEARQGKSVYRKCRLIITTIICFLVVFGVYFGVRGDIDIGNGAYAAEETIYKKVTIYSGDTLWNIASDYTEPSKDIRKLVKEICEINDVSPGDIIPGQTILVPIPAHLA